MVACTGQCAGIERMVRVGRVGHTTWHSQHWTNGRALRGNVFGHLLGLVCIHITHVGQGWDTQHIGRHWTGEMDW